MESSADLVRAIETAVRFYEEPPTERIAVTAGDSDLWLGADDWADAFAAVEPGTPHNEAREDRYVAMTRATQQLVILSGDG